MICCFPSHPLSPVFASLSFFSGKKKVTLKRIFSLSVDPGNTYWLVDVCLHGAVSLEIPVLILGILIYEHAQIIVHTL